MFPLDLLQKLVEIVLGDTIKNELQRRRDPKRKFARELLTLYEDIGRYRALCVELLHELEQEHQLIPSGRITPGTAADIQRLSADMQSLVKTILDRFGSEIHHLLWKRTRSGDRHERAVLEIHDPQLTQLMDAVYFAEGATVQFMDVLSHQLVDQKSHRIYMPKQSREATTALARHLNQGRRSLRDASPSAELFQQAQLTGLYDIFDLTNRQHFAALCALIGKNIEGAEELGTAIASHLREHYTVGDLL